MRAQTWNEDRDDDDTDDDAYAQDVAKWFQNSLDEGLRALLVEHRRLIGKTDKCRVHVLIFQRLHAQSDLLLQEHTSTETFDKTEWLIDWSLVRRDIVRLIKWAVGALQRGEEADRLGSLDAWLDAERRNMLTAPTPKEPSGEILCSLRGIMPPGRWLTEAEEAEWGGL